MRPASWRDQAACRDAPIEVFFPSAEEGRSISRGAYRAARAYCEGCPVRALCLDEALRIEGRGRRYGMLGGQTALERESAARLTRARAG